MKSIIARGLLYAAAGAAAVTGGIAINRAATHATLTEVLMAAGYTTAVYVSPDSGAAGASAARPVTVGEALAWDAYGADGDPLAWDAAYLARYGMHSAQRHGLPAMVRYCPEAYRIDVAALEALARRADNPLGLADHARWTYDRDAREDLRLLGRPGAGCGGLGWTNFLVPLLLPSGGPTPTPPPPPPTPTPEPPPPPDPDPPTWRYGWAVRQVECVGGAPNSLCLDLRFSPSIVSTGGMRVEVE